MYPRLTLLILLLSIATGSEAHRVQFASQYGPDASPGDSMADVQSGLDTEPTPDVSGTYPLIPNTPNQNTSNATGDGTGNTDVQSPVR